MPKQFFALGVLVSCWLVPTQGFAQTPAATTPWWSRATQAVRNRIATHEGDRYAVADFSVTDVNIDVWLRRLRTIGVTLPFSISGDLTAKLQFELPIAAPRTTRLYRFHGTLSSRRLVIEGTEIQNVSAEARYADGLLTLQELRFTIPGQRGREPSDGTVRGQGTLQLVPRGDLEATVVISGISIARVLEQLQLQLKARGRVNGTVRARVPGDRLRDLLAWAAEGSVTVRDLEAFDQQVPRVAFRFGAKVGRLTISDLAAVVEGARLSGTATAELAAPFRYTTNLRVTDGDLAALAQRVPQLTLPVPVEGQLQATAQATGTLQPFALSGAGHASLRNVKLDALAIAAVDFDYATDLQQVRLTKLLGMLYDGQFRGEATAPLGDGDLRLALQWSNVNLSPLAADLVKPPLTIAGRSGGTVAAQVPMRRVRDVAAWTASGTITLSDGLAYGQSLTNLTALYNVHNSRIELTDLRGRFNSGTLTGTARLALAAPYEFETAVRLTRTRLEPFNQVPEEYRPPVAVRGAANVSMQARGTMQPLRVTAHGAAAVAGLGAEVLTVDQAQFEFSTDGTQLKVDHLNARLYGGQAIGSVTVPLREIAAGELQLTWERIDVGRAASDWLGHHQTSDSNSGWPGLEALRSPGEYHPGSSLRSNPGRPVENRPPLLQALSQGRFRVHISSASRGRSAARRFSRAPCRNSSRKSCRSSSTRRRPDCCPPAWPHRGEWRL